MGVHISNIVPIVNKHSQAATNNTELYFAGAKNTHLAKVGRQTRRSGLTGSKVTITSLKRCQSKR